MVNDMNNTELFCDYYNQSENRPFFNGSFSNCAQFSGCYRNLGERWFEIFAQRVRMF